MRKRADKAGHWRYALPREYGGKDGTNLGMAIIREYLAAKGLGLHNDLQNESSIVGNLPTVLMFRDFGTEEQKKKFIPGILDGSIRIAFGLTETNHGSDATWMQTRAARDGDGGRGCTGAASGTPKCTRRGTVSFSRARGVRTGDGPASPVSSFRPRARASRAKSTCGPSRCRRAIRGCRSRTSACGRAGVWAIRK